MQPRIAAMPQSSHGVSRSTSRMVLPALSSWSADLGVWSVTWYHLPGVRVRQPLPADGSRAHVRASAAVRRRAQRAAPRSVQFVAWAV
ncbi:MAG: hypothetical protein EB005_03640, partial [Actinobacteria bacterium]|nr:hypothetical protein [Actinomycetota bacterium]